jgi:elongator complex protein 3
VVAGNRRTSLRMDVQQELKRRGSRCQCVRCREVRKSSVSPDSLQMEALVYQAGWAQEHFLSYVTPQDRLAGFLRLSLPGPESPDLGLSDLHDAALIREVHVYGQSLQVGAERAGAAQHIGLGTRLLEAAEERARQHGFARMAVIAAVGTRQYYEGRGYRPGERYYLKTLDRKAG